MSSGTFCLQVPQGGGPVPLRPEFIDEELCVVREHQLVAEENEALASSGRVPHRDQVGLIRWREYVNK